MDTHTPRISIPDIKARKHGTPLVCLTAYTTPMARILDPHADLLLVGDSIGNVLYGMENTLAVDLEMMIRHGQAVMRANPRACVIIDMPFGTYEESPEQAYRNAMRVMKETGADGIKLEGGQAMEATIAYLSARNIPVMAHIGLQPQSVIKDGGYKVKGKTLDDEERLLQDAKAIERAGAFSVVIEGTVEPVAQKMTKAISIPTIGIGASAACDGQILVTEDMLGMTPRAPKFVKQYADIAGMISTATAQYAAEVKTRSFPSAEYTYKRPLEAVKKAQ